MFHTTVTKLTASSETEAVLGATIPLDVPSPRTDPRVTLTPEIGGSSSFSSLDVNDYGSKAFKFLRRPISKNEFRSLVEQGWPLKLLETLFYERIILRSSLDQAIREQSDAKCEQQRYRSTNPCKILNRVREALGDCPETGSEMFVIYKNSGFGKCAYLKFQMFLARLRVVDGALNTRSEDSTITVYFANEKVDKEYKRLLGLESDQEGDDGFIDYETTRRELQAYRSYMDKSTKVFSEKALESFKEFYKKKVELERLLAEKRRELSNIGPFEIVFRSAYTLLRFLGGIAAQQLHGNPPYIPSLYLDETGQEVELFRVLSGDLSDAAVKIDHDGSTYSIPRPGYGNVNRARSMQVLTLLNELQTAAKAEVDLPVSNTLILQ